MDDYLGRPLEPSEAWHMFDRWLTTGQDVGVIFWGRSGNFYTLGSVRVARNGKLEIRGEGARATFNLVDAKFRYGPMQTWPRWPSPPIVEVMALRAELANGDYLALAEGLKPDSLPPRALPA
jgi:hypothetical protein